MGPEPYTLDQNSLRAPQNKNILITGGSSGIVRLPADTKAFNGFATAVLLHDHPSAQNSNTITILDRSAPPSHPIQKSSRFLFRSCDITSWSSQRAAFSDAVSKFGPLDAVFVNAGLAEHGDQMFKEDVDEGGLLKEPDRRTLNVDITALNDTIKLALYHLRSDKERDVQGKKTKQRGGSIVMTASLAGYLASAGAPLYSAAKHGVVGYLRALKGDCAKVGIAISVIAPGITLTPIILGRRPGQSLEDWASEMRERGVPINEAETVAMTVAHLMGLEKDANGMGVLIQGNTMSDLEAGIAKGREQWMGSKQLDLFRGGRNAPLFPNKL